MQYIVFIHGDSDSNPAADEWSQFFQVAQESGMFRGGSSLGSRYSIGTKPAPDSTGSIVGYMRFDSDNLDRLQDLLDMHPVVQHGGTIELREMPVT